MSFRSFENSKCSKVVATLVLEIATDSGKEEVDFKEGAMTLHIMALVVMETEMVGEIWAKGMIIDLEIEVVKGETRFEIEVEIEKAIPIETLLSKGTVVTDAMVLEEMMTGIETEIEEIEV